MTKSEEELRELYREIGAYGDFLEYKEDVIGKLSAQDDLKKLYDFFAAHTATVAAEAAREAREVQLKRYMRNRCGCLNCDAIADDLESLTRKSKNLFCALGCGELDSQEALDKHIYENHGAKFHDQQSLATLNNTQSEKGKS